MGLYSIITRAPNIVLTGFGSTSDVFNTDHENHVTNTNPDSINSWEEDVAQMNLTTDPAPSGTVSLAAALSGDLERLRFALASIKQALSGGTPPTQWYTPTASGSFAPVLPTTAARYDAATLRTIPSSATPTAIAWNTTTERTYSTPTSMTSSVLGITAPVTGIYMVGGRASFGDVVSTGPTDNARLVIRREQPVADVIAIQEIASQNVNSGLAAFPKSMTVEAVVQVEAGRRISLAISQTSGSDQIVSEGPSLWASLVAR